MRFIEMLYNLTAEVFTDYARRRSWEKELYIQVDNLTGMRQDSGIYIGYYRRPEEPEEYFLTVEDLSSTDWELYHEIEPGKLERYSNYDRVLVIENAEARQRQERYRQ